jgi:hypothetical protein
VRGPTSKEAPTNFTGGITFTLSKRPSTSDGITWSTVCRSLRLEQDQDSLSTVRRAHCDRCTAESGGQSVDTVNIPSPTDSEHHRATAASLKGFCSVRDSAAHARHGGRETCSVRDLQRAMAFATGCGAEPVLAAQAGTAIREGLSALDSDDFTST